MVKGGVKKFPSYEEMYERFMADGTDPRTAAHHAEELGLLSPPVKERFLHWWYTGEFFDDLEVKGYRISYFQKRYKYRLRCAFIDFNSLFVEPDGWMLDAIEKGISRIVFEEEPLPE